MPTSKLVQVPAERDDISPGEMQLFSGGLVTECAGMTEVCLYELGGAL